MKDTPHERMLKLRIRVAEQRAEKAERDLAAALVRAEKADAEVDFHRLRAEAAEARETPWRLGCDVALADAEKAEAERDEARADARALAHSFWTGNTPPRFVVERALNYPKTPVAPGTPAGGDEPEVQR